MPVEEEEAHSDVHSVELTSIWTRPVNYKPSTNIGFNYMVKQNILMGWSSKGGQLRQADDPVFMDYGLNKGLPQSYWDAKGLGNLWNINGYRRAVAA